MTFHTLLGLYKNYHTCATHIWYCIDDKVLLSIVMTMVSCFLKFDKCSIRFYKGFLFCNVASFSGFLTLNNRHSGIMFFYKFYISLCCWLSVFFWQITILDFSFSHVLHEWLDATCILQRGGAGINSVRLGDVIWCCRSWSTLVLVMAWCLLAPSHYQNLCWLVIIGPRRTNHGETWIMLNFSFDEMLLSMLSAKYQPLCSGHKVSTISWHLKG